MQNNLTCGDEGTSLDPTQDRDNKLWWRHQLYSGPGSTGFLPTVDDLIVDFKQNCLCRVIEVDTVNRTFVDVPWKTTEMENDDAILGSASYMKLDTYRVYIDDSRHPATLRVDSRWTVPGSDNQYLKIFRGTDISENGEVISAYFENNIYQGEKIPLATVSIDNVDNKTIKAPVPASCNAEVDDGELLTMVVYSDVSGVSLIARFHAVKTNLVMALDNPSRQIVDIKLKSPFLSLSDETLLELPINVPVDDIPLDVEVQYTDGKKTYTVDGTRAALLGLTNSGYLDTYYISSVAGQDLDLTLKYNMASNETYLGDDVVDRVIQRPYKATTLDVDGAYSVKLFVRPVWLDAARGYRLEYYLYNLDRGNWFEATAHVRLGTNSPFFDPKLYGVKQTLTVNCNLADVSPEYKTHIHPQTFSITLLAPATEDRDNFILEYVHGQEDYGRGCKAVFNYEDASAWSVDLSSSARSQAEWLQQMYYATHPIYDRRAEAKAPEPTHFELVVGSKVYLKLVSEWGGPFNIDFEVAEADSLMIRWIARTASDELHLGMSPVIAHQKA